MLALITFFVCIWNQPLVTDEWYHAHQVANFVKGDFRVEEYLTVLPVYHAIVAFVMRLFGADSMIALRLISFLGSLTSIPAFYLILQRTNCAQPALRLLQFVFLPVLFPFFFLVYTDAWGLSLVLWSVERALAGRTLMSSTALAAAVLFRTPNIVWAVLPCFLLLRNVDFPSLSRETLGIVLRRLWPFLVLFAAFAIFVVFNRGVAMGDKGHHSSGINLSNLYFFGLVFLVLFTPQVVRCIPPAFAFARRYLWICIAVLILGFALFMTTYAVTHDYNSKEFWNLYRNRVLFWTTEGVVVESLTFIPVLLGLISFAMSGLGSKERIAVVALTFLTVPLFPLIDPRYYIVPLSLFLAFKADDGRVIESINTGAFVVLSILLFLAARNYQYLL